MLQISATEAKARLAELLRTVEQGETVVITRHGRAIAHLVPAEAQNRAARQQAMERFLELRSKMGPLGVTRDELLSARREGLA